LFVGLLRKTCCRRGGEEKKNSATLPALVGWTWRTQRTPARGGKKNSHHTMKGLQQRGGETKRRLRGKNPAKAYKKKEGKRGNEPPKSGIDDIRRKILA